MRPDSQLLGPRRAYYQLLVILRSLRDEGVDPSVGICGNVDAQIRKRSAGLRPFVGGVLALGVQEALTDCIYEWPLRCSSVHHPVGGPAEYMTELDAGTLWNNPRRHQLLHWMIMFLENEVCPQ